MHPTADIYKHWMWALSTAFSRVAKVAGSLMAALRLDMPKCWRRRVARAFAHRGGSSNGIPTLKHPSSLGEDDLEVAQIRSALLKLPEVDRVALVLQVRCGRSPVEIASELKLTVPQVLTRLCRAREGLLLLRSDDTQKDTEE